MKREGRGFSLVEVMVSMALFILLVGLVIANTSFLNRYLVRAELDKMYTVFRYLQKTAMVSGQEQVLEFDVKKNRYMCGKRVFTLPSQVVFGVLPDVKGPPSAPQKIITKSITFRGKKVRFNKAGIIKSGTIYITDKAKHVMYAMSCSVAQASYLRKYAYHGKWIPIT